MKINLLLPLSPRNYLGNTIIVTSTKIPGGVLKDFIVDTGSERTILPWDVAKQLQIPIRNLQRYEQPIGLIGNKYIGYYYNHINLKFVGDNKKEISEDFPCLVIKPTSRKVEEADQAMPVIIGLDFIKERNYALYCNLRKEEAYLEKN